MLVNCFNNMMNLFIILNIPKILKKKSIYILREGIFIIYKKNKLLFINVLILQNLAISLFTKISDKIHSNEMFIVLLKTI